MLSKRPALVDARDHRITFDGCHREAEEAVVEQDAVAYAHVPRKVGIAAGHQVGGTHHLARRDAERLTLDQLHWAAIRKPAHSQLWTLQVLHDRDWATQRLSGGAHGHAAPPVLLQRAM